MSSNLKPLVTLKDENGFVNYLEWKRAWETYFSSYGTAGKEVMEDREIRALERKPVVAATIEEEQFVNGRLQRVQRAMTAEDKKQVPARVAAWETAEEKYMRAKGQLFVSILSTLEASLVVYVENQADYEQILRQNNVRLLWKLIRRVCSNKGGSQVDLIMKWRNLDQKSKTLSEHINQFEKLYANIDTEAHPISARGKSEQLVKSVDLEFFKPIIGRYLILIERPVPEGQPDPFPGYNDVKDELIRYDEIMKKNKLKNDYEGSNDTVLYANKDELICYNCQQHGHYQRICNNPPKCVHCGGKHRSDQHNFQIRKPVFDKTKKMQIAKMVKRSSSSSSSNGTASSTNGVVSGGKKMYKKPLDLKHRDKPKQYKKVYYLQEIDDDEEVSDDDDGNSEHDSVEIDETDDIYQNE